MDIADTNQLALSGTKRKAVGADSKEPKKPRNGSTTNDSDCPTSSKGGIGDESSEEESSSTAPTPLSSTSSPRYPSLLKTNYCPYSDCNKAFNRPARLRDHLRSHTNTRPFACSHPQCTKDFLRETHLKHHTKSAHCDVRDYVCQTEGCGKSFATSTRLKRHHAAHEGKDEFKCSNCSQEFRKHATLQRHIATEHEGRNALTCEKEIRNGQPCGRGFDKLWHLKLHQGRMHGDDRYFCTICQNKREDTPEGHRTSFPTYAEWQDHVKVVHPPTCVDCGFTCNTSRELNRHSELQHGGGVDERRMHVCSEPGCERAFTKRGNLTVHLRTVHSQERPFVCGAIDPSTLNNTHGWDGSGACGKHFKHRNGLEEHVRTVHLGMANKAQARKQKKKDKAPNRNKAKVSAVALLTGTGYDEDPARQIACLLDTCAWRFTRGYDLDMHMQAHHGVTDLEIQALKAERYADDMEIDTQTQEFGAHLEGGAGQFWIGGADSGRYDDWEADEAEMYALVDADEEDGDKMLVDPLLKV